MSADDDLDVADFTCLAEAAVAAEADADRRRAALQRRDKANKAADSQARAALASDAPPAVTAAKLAAARSRKNVAAAEFTAAVSEAFGPPTVVVPRGRRAMHYDRSGRLVAVTEWHGNGLVTTSAAGIIMARTVIA